MQRNTRVRSGKEQEKHMLLAYIICVRDVIRSGIINPLYIVHHKDYIDESNYIDDNVFFNWDNLEGLCLDCHNKEHFKEEAEYGFDENGDLIKMKTK